MVEGIKGNFKNWFKDSYRKCQGCKSVEDSQLHVLVSGAYVDLRLGGVWKRIVTWWSTSRSRSWWGTEANSALLAWGA